MSAEFHQQYLTDVITKSQINRLETFIRNNLDDSFTFAVKQEEKRIEFLLVDKIQDARRERWFHLIFGMGAYEDEWYLLGKRQKELTDRLMEKVLEIYDWLVCETDLKVVLYDEVFWQDGSLVLFRDRDDIEGWQMVSFSEYQEAKFKNKTVLSKLKGVGRC